MYIQYLGHACVLVTISDGQTILMDPPEEKYGYVLPDMDVSIALMSHYHGDHSAVKYRPRQPAFSEGKAIVSGKNLQIRYYDCWHDDCRGEKRGANRVFRIEADGVSIVHLGDLGHYPDEGLLAFVRGADIVIAPVGGVFTLEPEQISDVLDLFGCKSILPVHYRTARSSLQQLHPLTDFLSYRKGDRKIPLPACLQVVNTGMNSEVTIYIPQEDREDRQ